MAGIGIIDIVRNGLSRLRPTNKNNVESELEPGDYDLGTAPPQSQDDKNLADLIDKRHEASYQQRRVHDPEYMESLGFYRGQQWHEWRSDAGRLYDLRDKRDPDRIYAVNNKIKPIAKSLIARAIQSDVTVTPKPCTTRPIDVACSDQMRAVISHVQYVNKWTTLLHRMYRHCIVVGPCYAKIFWDNNAIVPLPEFDANGELSGVVDAKKGEIRIEFVSTFDLYPDPKARYWDEAEWVIHAKRRSLEYIKARYPEEGKWVQADKDGPQEIVQNQLDNLTGDGNARGTGTAQHTAILKELWEKPSVRFPKGRYVVSAGGRILYSGDWPYKRMSDFPFEPLCYDDGIETLWGDNAVFPLTGPQRHYNRLISKQQEHARKGDGKLLAPRGAGIEPGAFKTAKRDEVVYYNHADEQRQLLPEPHYMEAPGLDASILEGIRLMDDDMKGISSVNDVSQGLIPSSGMSGAAIANLQQADSSINNIFRENLKGFAEGVFSKVGQLAQDMYLEPRLMYVQDSVAGGGSSAPSPITQAAQAAPGVPMLPQGQPLPPLGPSPDGPPALSSAMQAVAFTKFGEGRFTLEAVVAAGQSIAARQQFIQGIAQAGGFQPQNIPSTIVLLRALEVQGADKVVTDLIASLEISLQVHAAMNPGPPPPPQPPDPVQAAQIQTQVDQSKIAAQAQADTQKQTTIIEAQAQAGIAKEQAIRHMPPTVNLAGKLTPGGEVAAEEAALGTNALHEAAGHVAGVANASPETGKVYGVEPTPPPPAPPTKTSNSTTSKSKPS